MGQAGAAATFPRGCLGRQAVGGSVAPQAWLHGLSGAGRGGHFCQLSSSLCVCGALPPWGPGWKERTVALNFVCKFDAFNV